MPYSSCFASLVVMQAYVVALGGQYDQIVRVVVARVVVEVVDDFAWA